MDQIKNKNGNKAWLSFAGMGGFLIAIVAPNVVGDARKPDNRREFNIPATQVETAPERRAHLEIEPSRFAPKPVITYKTVACETFFALKLQPTLESVSRPRDVLVLVDTSASQAGGPLKTALEVTQSLVKILGPGDRISLWTANLQPKSLSSGFTSPGNIQGALATLGEIYPSGATALKICVTAALESFEPGNGRQRSIIFMGDGLSVADPLDPDARTALAAEMVKREISFIPIPLGTRMDPINIHGLATATGGRTLRIEGGETLDQMSAKIDLALKSPILYPENVQFADTVQEVLPTRLPPIRTDVPTLIVGKVKETGANKPIGFEIGGRVGGLPTKVSLSMELPPPEEQNFFLTQVVGQWREKKDRPALLQGDRALVAAFEQNRLAMEDSLARGEFALRNGRPDAAAKLYRLASQLDPVNPEARAGIQLCDAMVQGKLKPEEMAAKLGIPGLVVAQFNSPRSAEPGANNPGIPNPNSGANLVGNDAIKEVQARRTASEQQVQNRVNEGIKEAHRQLRESPSIALEDLKRLKDEVENNIDIGMMVRNNMVGRLVREIQRTEKDGREIERQQREFTDAHAKILAMADEERRVTIQSERIKERMRFYHDLMSQAREEEAQRVAQTMRRDLNQQGMEIPQAVTAAYYEGGRGYHLRQLRDLRRVREENFLATLLEVERSHIPFPDEPPVVWANENSPLFQRKAFDRTFRFRNWKELSEYRRNNYNNPGYTPPVPESARKIRDILTSQVDIKEFDLPSAKVIKDVIQSVLSDRFGVDLIINYKAFEADGNDKVEDQEVGDRKIRPFKGKLSNWLRIVTEDHIKGNSGATFLIRDDHVEITTQTAALNEKVIRIYPVADLIFPIQNAVNPAQIQQSSTLYGFGGSYGLAGQSIASGGLGGLGALGGGLGALGGGLGALGGGLGALGGGLGALGGGLGVLGGGGGLGALGVAGALGGGMGGLGGLGAGQLGGNLGAGAVGNFGMVGTQGGIGNQGATGTAGQFGNLGGQFGLQGGPNWSSLMYTIKYMVGTSKDWTYQAPPPGAGVANPTSNFYGQGEPDGVQFGENGGTFGPYPPAFALIVRNTSRTHTGRFTPPFTFGASANPNPNMVAAPGENKALAQGNRNNPGIKDGIAVAQGGEKALLNAKDNLGVDPRKVWHEALGQGVNNPALIIATADYLGSNGYWEHAAEFLKANLRHGLIVKPWVYQSLAIALKESGASPEEIEKAEVASADLEPFDSKEFSRAAKGMARTKNYERAVAFARQASFLDQNSPQPLIDTLAYAELANKPEVMNWAGSVLLSKDWNANNEMVHERARDQLSGMARRVEPRDPETAKKLKETLNSQERRDLVVHLAFRGDADVDLKVKEPTGSVCSTLQKQTIGGGLHIGNDILTQGKESYVASEAFSGDFEIRIEKVWGKTLGEKAQLRIIRYQGTPKQFEEVMQIDLSKAVKPIKIRLDQGRRTEFAYVTPPVLDKKKFNKGEWNGKVQDKLYSIANPAIVGSPGPKVVMVTPGSEVPLLPGPSEAKQNQEGQVLYQTRVNSFMKNALDMTTEVIMSADGKGQRSRLNLIDRGRELGAPVVNSSVIPGDQ